jgi:hypothetical protein
MAKVLPNGLISGRIGNLIYYVVDGKQFVRLDVEANDPKTMKQLLNRAKMRQWNQFLNSFKSLLTAGYPVKGPGLFDRKEAAQYHMEHAFEVSFNEEKHEASGQLIPEKVRLSKGRITPPEITSCIRNGNEIELTWNPALGPVPNLFTDALAVAAYVPGKKAFTLLRAGTRKEGHAKITLSDYPDEPVHLWFFFWNDQMSRRLPKDKASETVYVIL